ncbi:MAG: SusF/SusE family outer membrane protein [Bacteroidota bacterium]
MKKIFILSVFLSLVIFSACKKDLEVQGPPIGSGPVTISLTTPTPAEAISSNQVYQFTGTINAPKGLRSAYLNILGQQIAITGSSSVVNFSVPVTIPENIATGQAYSYSIHAVDFAENVGDLNGTFTLTQSMNASIIAPIKGVSAAVMAGLSGDFKLRLNYSQAPTSVKIIITYSPTNIQEEVVDLTNTTNFYLDANDPKGSHIAMKSVTVASSVDAGVYPFVFEVINPIETITVAGNVEVIKINTLFVIGDATTAGWDINNPIPMNSLGANLFGKGLVLDKAPKGFKFVLTIGSWDVNWGTSETAAIALGTDYALVPGGGNIMVPDSASYVISVDFQTNTFKVTKFAPPTSLFLVGGSIPTGWDPALAVPFTKTADGVFQIYSPLTASGGGYKFLETLGSWTGAWGQKPGFAGTILQDGAENCPVTEDGFYRITVDFNAMTFVAMKTQWGIIGDATVGGWNYDTNMVYVGGAEPYTWELQNYTYTGASFKFRANDAWTTNFGDDGNNGTLEPNGANIAITAGVHTVRMTLAPTGYTYTVTP